ncbi:hypothetical protein CA267_016030 [Alteromonas pelagimontana]|uniref:DUF4410 domain-containing protein n=1 Tax=Alteromonas pelagimontana TaxID=1858656 RepID=A0A6M4MG45_9ALTE|nr:hypothetical protein [Alteromonas pelagimontana]QJR82151.1 hypothetical protein CA267_016030 [Alteromonas pelagimontana]
MNKLIFTTLFALLATGCASTTPTKSTEQAYLIINIPGDSSIRQQVVDTVITTVKENMNSLTYNQGIPPALLPATAPRFTLVNPFGQSGFAAMAQAQGMNLKVPQCQDPLLTIKSDSSTSGWSESTTFFTCVVQYADGYHVDIYATFEQESGGLSVNALSQSLARSVVGDTSQLIPRTMKRIQIALQNASPETSVVDSYIPSRWKGVFVDDTVALEATE